jgi:hypothetical protein
MAHTHNNHYYTPNNQAPLTAQSAHTTHTTYHNYHISQHQIPAHQHAHLPAQHHHSVTNQPDSRPTTQHHDNRPARPRSTIQHDTHDTTTHHDPAQRDDPGITARDTTAHTKTPQTATQRVTATSRPDHPDLPTCPYCTPFAHPDREAYRPAGQEHGSHTRCRSHRAWIVVGWASRMVHRCVVCAVLGCWIVAGGVGFCPVCGSLVVRWSVCGGMLLIPHSQ